MIVNPDSADVTTYFVLRKAADGTEVTGAVIADIDLVYTRSGADHSTKADATALATPDAAHADNKAIEVDATSAPGLYRIDWPDAAFAGGAREVILTVIYASAFVEHLRVELIADFADIHTDVETAVTQATEANAHAHNIDANITAAYGSTEKAAIDLLDDTEGGLADIHADLEGLALAGESAAALAAYDPPTRAEATADKDEVIDAVESYAGSGAQSKTYRVRDLDTGAVVVGALVRLFTDPGRTVPGPEALTDSTGIAHFKLDPGTYYPRISYGAVEYDEDPIVVS